MFGGEGLDEEGAAVAFFADDAGGGAVEGVEAEGSGCVLDLENVVGE